MDRNIRPLPKKLTEIQRAVLAYYPYARCGDSRPVRKHMLEYVSKSDDIFYHVGKNCKWAIYVNPESPHLVLLQDVVGLGKTQTVAWFDAYNVMNLFIMRKLEK